jgi:predicted nucleotide-binding protein (sugar kinase/HSP70/actin superfamily)
LPLRKDKIWLIPHLDDAASSLAGAALRRFGFETLVLEETPESIVRGLKLVGGGECVPVAALLGGIVETLEKRGLSADRTAAMIPTSMVSCNFPQIPLAVQAGLRKAGLEELRVFTTGTVDQRFSLSLNLSLTRTYVIGSLLHQMAARVRPDEARPGQTEEVKKAAVEKLSRAIIGKKDWLDSFREVVEDFLAVPTRRSGEPRPLLIILGDLYVVCNSTFNQGLEKAIEAAGGEALPASFIDIGYVSALNNIEKCLKNRNFASLARVRALNTYIRHCDLQFRKAAAPVLGGIHPLMDGSLLQKLREMGLPPELDGETCQNVLRVFYYLRHMRPDGFVHINPLYCCPGAVSTALLGGIAREFGVPVVHLFYDGIHSPNENLEPTIHYLKQRKSALDRKR